MIQLVCIISQLQRLLKYWTLLISVLMYKLFIYNKQSTTKMLFAVLLAKKDSDVMCFFTKLSETYTHVY